MFHILRIAFLVLFLLIPGWAQAQTDEIIVFWGGASTSVGTQPPVGGTALLPGHRYIKGGIEQSALPANNSGPQRGFMDCMADYDIVLVERGATGKDSTDVRTTQVDNLINDAVAFGLETRVNKIMILFGGGPDSITMTKTALYSFNTFGPWYTAGPDSSDISLFGRLRERWGPTFPFVVATTVQWNGGDPLTGEVEDDNIYNHDLIRTQQMVGCQINDYCWTVLTTQANVPLDGAGLNQHPLGPSYIVMGEGACIQAQMALGLRSRR